MKVILQKNVSNLGQKGDIKEVADGYARNYLLPRGFAVEASAGRVQEMEMQDAKKSRREAKERQEAVALADKLEGKVFTIQATAGDGGRLFGSVTTADIAGVLAEEGIRVDRKKIDIGEPIKTLGNHTVEVKLYPQVSVSLVVSVEQKD